MCWPLSFGPFARPAPPPFAASVLPSHRKVYRQSPFHRASTSTPPHHVRAASSRQGGPRGRRRPLRPHEEPRTHSVRRLPPEVLAHPDPSTRELTADRVAETERGRALRVHRSDHRLEEARR